MDTLEFLVRREKGAYKDARSAFGGDFVGEPFAIDMDEYVDDGVCCFWGFEAARDCDEFWAVDVFKVPVFRVRVKSAFACKVGDFILYCGEYCFDPGVDGAFCLVGECFAHGRVHAFEEFLLIVIEALDDFFAFDQGKEHVVECFSFIDFRDDLCFDCRLGLEIRDESVDYDSDFSRRLESYVLEE